MIFKVQVQRRSDVLGRKNLYVLFLLFLVGEEGSPVGEFRIWRLGIVVWKRFRTVIVALVRRIEDGIVCLFSFKIVVSQYR